jgi:integrase/recombinase XerD
MTKYSKQWLRVEELEKMFSYSDLSEKYEIWMYLLYTPALRVSEAINVRVRDLDEKHECIEIWGGKGRDISEMQKTHCDAKVIKRIQRYCEHNNLRPNDFIMFSQKSKQVDRSQVYRVVNDICHAVGIDKKIGTHTLRRSRAEHLLDNGLQLTYVSKYLRHKNLSTTMKYLDISLADIQKELGKINDTINVII